MRTALGPLRAYQFEANPKCTLREVRANGACPLTRSSSDPSSERESRGKRSTTVKTAPFRRLGQPNHLPGIIAFCRVMMRTSSPDRSFRWPNDGTDESSENIDRLEGLRRYQPTQRVSCLVDTPRTRS